MLTSQRRWFRPSGFPLALMLILCIGGLSPRLPGAEVIRRSFAIAAGDAEGARAILAQHVDTFEREIRAVL